MTYYIRDIIKIAQLDFKTAVSEIMKVNPDFKVNGGPNTEIDFETFKATCQNNSIEVEDNGRITIYKDTDNPNKVVKFAPITSAKPEPPKITYNDKTLEEFNKLKANKIDPLKVKAMMLQVPGSAAIALEFIKQLKTEKTILNDSLIHDYTYLKNLFKEYTYIICPVQLGKRIRTQLEPLFIKMFLTDNFNNKIIVFNSDSAIYAYILNV